MGWMRIDPADLVWFVFRRRTVTRREISERFGLGSSTTAVVVRKLIDKGFLLESEVKRDGIGRSPKVLRVNPEAAKFCGVDMSSDEVRVAVYDFGVSKLFEDSMKLGYENPIRSLRILTRYLNDLTHDMEVNAVGVALPGILDGGTGALMNSAVEELEGFDVLGLIRSGVEVPVLGVNDANAAALAEYYSRKDEETLLGVFISKGVGMGLILKGEVFTGRNGYAGEFGNMVLPGGRVDELLPGWKIVNSFSRGDDLDWVVEKLSEALANVVFLLDPGLVVLLSNFPIPHEFVDELGDDLRERLGYPFGKGIKVERSVVNGSPTVLGSAIAAVRRWVSSALTP